jgi:hypothetical protein
MNRSDDFSKLEQQLVFELVFAIKVLYMVSFSSIIVFSLLLGARDREIRELRHEISQR